MLTEVFQGSASNCDFETSLEKRCLHCKQNHLTPGYCQALDPRNADKYTHLHKSHDEAKSQNVRLVETETAFESHNETAESQPWTAEGISRATYFRRKRNQSG